MKKSHVLRESHILKKSHVFMKSYVLVCIGMYKRNRMY